MTSYFLGNAVGRRRVVPELTFATEKVAEYVSAYFERNPDKPRIRTLNGTNRISPAIRQTVKAQLLAGNLHPTVATAFLAQEFIAVPALLTEAWSSFGVVISEANRNISIADLCTIEGGETMDHLVAGDDMTDDEILKHIIIICSIYRLLGITNNEYRGKIVQSVNDVMRANSLLPVELGQALGLNRSWMAYTPLKKMIAIVDMFLNRFPSHVYAAARFGTIVSRLRDCGVLSEIMFLRKTLNVKIEDILPFLWTEQVARQFNNIVREGEELDNSYSYGMYASDLELVQRSPYSVGMNPELHFWIHVIGCCLLKPRSINARLLEDTTIPGTLQNAMVTAYALGQGSGYGKWFGAADEELLVVDPNYEDDPDLPQGTNAMVWLGNVINRGNRIPDGVKAWCARQWENFQNVRNGTIGDYLRNQAHVLLNT